MKARLGPSQLRLLRLLAVGKVLVNHRSGWVISDGSQYFGAITVQGLIKRALIAPPNCGGPNYRITDAGRSALAGTP